MTNDDQNHVDDGGDLRLSKAYRQLAKETTPESLDTAVLAEARRSAQQTRSGFARWRRPLAWATMIALSSAIVLEFNQTVTVDEQGLDESAFRDAPAGATDRQELEAKRQDELLQKSAAAALEADKRSRDEELSTMSAPARAALRSDLVPSAPDTTGPANAVAINPSQPMLEADAERFDELVMPAGEGYAGGCRDNARDNPVHWRECILALFEAGRIDDMQTELRLYRQAFPSEPLPRPTQ